MTRTLFFESEPDSSLTGPGAFSGEELAGAVVGVLLFGTTTGASAGVAELDGMPAGVSGVAALVGACGKFGAPTGTDSGALAGDEIGVGRLTGDGIGGDPFADGLGVGETDCAGETDGDFAGGVDNVGEIAGVDVGGDKAGDFEGDAGEIVGVDVGGDNAGEVVGEVAGECEGLVGEIDGEGDFVGVGVEFGLGDGEGALSACTKPLLLCDTETHKTKMESTTRQCFIFFVWKHTHKKLEEERM
ncbi:hypothetical protein CMV_013992 [Castanea mollissima]|uniref:Uncharacterized protein n=1 Tax=Castanea mollissima TaxID=60419 RepID=A0A8J4RC29_9ROSI|nr:hypothetical protein CMV_013992 [Castanea mollissima]